MRLTAEEIRAHARKNGLRCALDCPPAPTTPAPAPAPCPDDAEPPDAFTGAEKLLHRDFASDMARRGAWCVSCRTDKAATIPPGYPDFHVLFTGPDGTTRGCAVEFKKAGGRLSDAQREVIADMRQRRIPVKVCWTLAHAIAFARAQLGC